MLWLIESRKLQDPLSLRKTVYNILNLKVEASQNQSKVFLQKQYKRKKVLVGFSWYGPFNLFFFIAEFVFLNQWPHAVCLKLSLLCGSSLFRFL